MQSWRDRSAERVAPGLGVFLITGFTVAATALVTASVLKVLLAIVIRVARRSSDGALAELLLINGRGVLDTFVTSSTCTFDTLPHSIRETIQ